MSNTDTYSHYFESRVFSSYVDKNDIYVTEFKEDVEIETEDIKEILEQYDKVSEAKKMLVLSIAGSYTTVTFEARKYAEANGSLAIAEAFVVNSIAQRMLVTVYMNIRKNKHPTKVFSDIKSAQRWLISQK